MVHMRSNEVVTYTSSIQGALWCTCVQKIPIYRYVVSIDFRFYRMWKFK
jgi:hypothetical protein